MKRLAILGSTGSIGVSTLDIVEQFPERFKVVSLAAGVNTQLLKQQILQFRPKVISVLNRELSETLRRELASFPVDIVHGVEGLIQVATHPEVDQVVSALVGAVGLIPTLSAIKAGKNIALANKESLVMAGGLVMEEARQRQIQVLPVDSEHSAVFQALLGHRKEDVLRIILTASGGPFLHLPLGKLQEVTAREALRHPNWEMGRKITVDSASLMNKGLEVIEAHWLFDVPVEKIDVQIHPQSVIHSMVEYVDGSIVSQLGITDMRIPISYALAFPERLNLPFPRLNLFQKESLSFLPPDPERFPCLDLAYRAIKIGGTMPATLNAANEIAVNAFLDGALPFTKIPSLIRQVMEEHDLKPAQTLEDVLRADRWARETSRAILERKTL
jgi:1-deoxy-D-xylulose-5-phosphate reductoisomerase